FRAGQIAEVFDSADRDEIVRLDEVAGGPRDARRKSFGVDLRTELDYLFDAVGVPDMNLGVGAGETFFDKREGRLRLPIAPAGSTGEVELLDLAWVGPDQRGAHSRGLFLFLNRLARRRGEDDDGD